MAKVYERLKTNEVRFSFVHVFEKKKSMDGNEEKYSCVLMISKKNKQLIEKIQAAIKKVYDENSSMLKGAKLSKCLEILKDGDADEGLAERYPEFEGHMHINVSSHNKVPVLHKVGGVALTDSDEFKSGDFGFADLTFFPYDAGKNKGVGCGINSILKTRDGDDLSGGATNALATWADDIEDDM